MRFPANCLAVALLRGHVRTRAMRNRAGRLHYFWRDQDGLAWEFYAHGRSRRSYLANLLYVGEVRRMPSHDALPVIRDMGVAKIALAFVAVPLVIWLGAPRPSLAADDMLAVALVCPAGVEAADCSRANALDVLSQPAGPMSCLKVGAELATHLAYGPGERAKVVCERRKG